jgi:hypothetical protein
MGWKKILTVAALSTAASIAGIQSELLASNGANVYNFHGRGLTAQWYDFAPVTGWYGYSYAIVEANEGVTGPGKPQATATAWTYGSAIDYTDAYTYEKDFSASSDIPAGSPNSVSVTGNGASGSINLTNLPGSYSSWTPTAWNYGSALVDVQASLTADSVYGENNKDSQYFRSPSYSYRTVTNYHSQTGYVNSGSGSITVKDTTGNVIDNFVPAKTAVGGGYLRNITQATRTQ